MLYIEKKDINVNFDFTTDTPHYWDNYWGSDSLLGHLNNDPDSASPTLVKDKAFFDLFNDFKGYVDFFYLQDCVTPDYKKVSFWLGDGKFKTNPLPETVDDYLHWINCQLEFVECRNERINKEIVNNGI